MLNFNNTKDLKDIKNIIFIGAHLDDIEIGCGGFIKSLAESLEEQKSLLEINTHFLNISSGLFNIDQEINDKRAQAYEVNLEKIKFINLNKLNVYSKIINKRMDTKFFNFKNLIKDHLNNYFLKLSKKIDLKETIVFFNSADNHEDHRITNELVKEIFRPFFVKALIEYEIPSSNLYGSPGDNFNWYFSMDKETLEFKKELLESYLGISLHASDDARGIRYTTDFNKLQAKKMNLGAAVERFNIVYWS